mgnify:CR=1 FL=1
MHYTFRFILLSIICLSFPASAQYKISNEAEYPQNIATFTKFFKSSPANSFIATAHKGESISLDYKSFHNPKAMASVVIIQGFSESFFKYQEFIYDLYQNGLSVHIFNARGHGKSKLTSEPSVHVDDFNHYLSDLNLFLKHINLDKNQPKLIFAHSLGGAIASRYLQVFPGQFDGAILSSPLIKMKTPPFPYFLAEAVVSFGDSLGFSESLAVGQSLPQNNWTLETANNQSKLRFEFYRKTSYSPELMPLRRAGATYGFLSQVFENSALLRQESEVKKIEVPILIAQAGNDSWVVGEAQNNFCDIAPNCEIFLVEGAKHEIYHEADIYRKPYLNKILRFINDNFKRP